MSLTPKIKIFIVMVILSLIFIGGILVWQYGFYNKSRIIHIQPDQSLNLKTTKLATIPWYYYRVGGVFIPEFEFNYAGNVLFNSNGRQVAYTSGGSGKRFLVVNGNTNKKYSFYTNLVFSPDGQKIAYSASNNRGIFVVINGQENKVSGASYIQDIVFSADSKNVAYKVFQGGGKRKYFVVLNGQRGKEYNVVSNLVFSPDSKHLAYMVSEDFRKKAFAVLNGQEGKSYNIIFPPFLFSPDGQRLAYVALNMIDDTDEGRRYFLVLGDQEIKGYATGLIFSPDSSKVAYVSSDHRGRFIVIRGQETIEEFVHCGRFSSYVFSPDSKHLAYAAGCNIANESGETSYKETAFVTDFGQVGKAYNSISNITFSPDGEQIAYVAREGRDIFVVLNGQEGKKYEHYSSRVASLSFSPDSKHLAYKVKEGGKEFVVIDGQKGQVYDWIQDLIYSPDSQYLAYGARKGNSLWWIVDQVETR